MKICAVMVTYNRIDKLKKALLSYTQQTSKPELLLIVNNNSADGTKEYLEEWKANQESVSTIVVNLNENIGGSGGFCFGIEYALQKNCDWIFVADDDAYLDKDCIRVLKEKATELNDDSISALCAMVMTDKGIDTWHRRRLTKGPVYYEERINEGNYKKESFRLDFFSYVGTMMNAKKIRDAGLPEKDFFISYDDSEHSLRMRKYGELLCIPKAIVFHDSNDSVLTGIDVKKYYNIRNKLYSYKKHFGQIQYLIYRYYYTFKYRNLKGKEKEIVKKAIIDSKYNVLGRQ